MKEALSDSEGEFKADNLPGVDILNQLMTGREIWEPQRSLNINGSVIAIDYQPYQLSQIYCGHFVLCGSKNLNYCLFEPKETFLCCIILRKCDC